MNARTAIPLALFVLLLVILGVGLTRDPSRVESPLIGKPAPAFNLPTLQDPSATLSLADLQGQVVLLNVWASWCFACRDEHQMLLAIAQSGAVPIYGFNYKDTRENASRWLDSLGDPYRAVAFDESGRVGIDFGVYGAPETFLLDRRGIINYKQIGPITPEDWQQQLLPRIRQLQAQPQ